jgi:hypothetical protein
MQPKGNVSYTRSPPSTHVLLQLRTRNFQPRCSRGRAEPTSPVATTDFYQVSTSHALKRVSLSTDFVLMTVLMSRSTSRMMAASN